MENVLIISPQKFDLTKNAMQRSGAGKAHFLVDFDRTLTKYQISGKKVPSLISILRDGNYLTSDYGSKAQALFDKYHPLELDQSISIERKRDLMKQWWREHFDLLIKSGLKKGDIDSVVRSGKVELREGCPGLLKFLHGKDIPVVIMSNSGLGNYAIEGFLKNANCYFENIHIISNQFVWDCQGRAVGILEPIMHGGGKVSILVQDYPQIFQKISERKNVILIGDNESDVDMVEGFDCDNLLKIGFLNDKIEEGLETYKKVYDALILNDSSMEFVLSLSKEIF